MSKLDINMAIDNKKQPLSQAVLMSYTDRKAESTPWYTRIKCAWKLGALAAWYFCIPEQKWSNELTLGTRLNRKFWKTLKPALSDKCRSNNKIILVEEDEMISDDIEVAEICKLSM